MNTDKGLQKSEPKTVTRNYLKSIAKDLVRKDFEIYRIQGGLQSVFRDAEIFSKYSDELSSIKHVVELASGDILENELEHSFFMMVKDSAEALAMYCELIGTDSMLSVQKNTSMLVDLIFDALIIENEHEMELFFIQKFKTLFPTLEVTTLDIKLAELQHGQFCYAV